jgi:hypothetical protein
VSSTADSLPDDVTALKAALLAERTARQGSEARAAGAEAMVAHLKLLIAKLKRDRFGASAERGRKLLDQLEMQLEDLETEAAIAEAALIPAPDDATTVRRFTRRKPVRAPLPGHLPRERLVLPAPSACPCCGGRLAKLGRSGWPVATAVPILSADQATVWLAVAGQSGRGQTGQQRRERQAARPATPSAMSKSGRC